jgi:hypothetical protein
LAGPIKFPVAKSGLIWYAIKRSPRLKKAIRRRQSSDQTAVHTNSPPCIGQIIQPFLEITMTALRIGGIIWFLDALSLFANLRIGNTETYVFLVAEDT